MKRILTILSCVLLLLLCVTCQENNIFLGDAPVQPETPSGEEDAEAMLEANIDCVKGGIDVLKSDDEAVFKQRFENWLNDQDFIEEFSMEDYSDCWEYDITYKDGTNSYFVFIRDNEVGYNNTKRMSRSSDVGFISVPEAENEQIISQGNMKAMIFEPLNMWSKDCDEKFEEILERSPIKCSYLHSYENLDALYYIQNFDVVLLTNTHGFGDGSFSVSDNDVNREYIRKNIDPKLVICTFVLWSSFIFEDVLVLPLNGVGLNNMKEKSILYGDYCWSALNGGFNNIFKGNHVGYDRKTNALDDNYYMVDSYFTHLFNGFTHENAFKNTKYKNECISSNNKHPKLRFFSISTGDANDIEDKNGAYIVDGTINGYANLKDDVEYRIYYSKENFSNPNDDIDFKKFSPTGNGDVEVELNELDFDTEYFYCVAMAYNDRVYHGEVKSFKTENYDSEFVDLGLSVLWARCNVGANRPEESGGYYAWGEKTEKDSYSRDSYSYFKHHEPDSENWFGWYEVLKYCLDSDNGNVDGLKTLQELDDVAMDSSEKIRMPSKAEFEELVKQCVWKRDSINGVWGYKVIGPNKNSIFLPASGIKEYTSLNYPVTRGIYWSNELDMEYVWPDTCPNSYSAYTLEFSTGWIKDRNDYVDYGKREEKCSSAGREYGCTVRAVKEKQQ